MSSSYLDYTRDSAIECWLFVIWNVVSLSMNNTYSIDCKIMIRLQRLFKISKLTHIGH